MAGKFVEYAKDQYVNVDHIVKAKVSIGKEQDGEWQHYCFEVNFVIKHKQIIICLLIDGSLIRTNSIDDGPYYSNVLRILI